MKNKLNNLGSSGGSYSTYIVGFVLSLGMTLIAYLLVSRHVDSHHLVYTDRFLITAVSILAITQLVVQLVFFLHLDKESRPWWNRTALLFAATVVLILVFGSVWIMENLDYHHGSHNVTHDGHELNSPAQTDQYIINDEGIHQ